MSGSSQMLQFFSRELQNTPAPSRRFEIIFTLGILIYLPSDQAQAPLILQILLEDLRAEPSYVRIGIQTIEVISKFSRHFDSVDGPRLIQQLTNAWPQLFQWVWNHAYHLDHIPPPNVLIPGYISATVNILSLYANHPTLFPVAAENEETPTLLLSRLWCMRAQVLQVFPNEWVAAFGIGGTVSSIVTDPTRWMHISNNEISSTIDLVLRAPSVEFAALSPDISCIEGNLGLIVELSRASRHTYAFANLHSSVIIVNALISLSNFSVTPSHMPVVAKCVSLCVEHLCLILEAAIGFNAILETLDASLLPALTKCYAKIPQLNVLVATDHDAASLLTLILSKYLIYISVRDRVSKSLETIEADAFEKLLPPHSPFAVAWSNFKAQALHLMQTQERRGRFKYEILCSNITCRKSKSKAALSCCSRCHHSFYCSKACQIYDWKYGGHKKSCQNPYPDRKTFPISSRDLLSVDEVVRQDLQLRLPEIRAAWNTPVAPVVVFDYNTNPPCFRTTTAEAHRPYGGHVSEQQRLFWRETVGMVGAARRRGLAQGIVVIDVPGGLTPYSTAVMVTLDELEATATASGPLFGPSTLCVG